MSRFVLTPQAELDLNAIWDFIAEDNVGAADRVLDDIEKATLLAMNNSLLKSLHVDENTRLLIIMHLLKSGIVHLHEQTEVSTMVACFHPTHELFYRGLAFEPLGELKKYGSVGDNPAVAFKLNLKYEGDDVTLAGKRFFQLDIPKVPSNKAFSPHRFSLKEVGQMFIESKDRESEPS